MNKKVLLKYFISIITFIGIIVALSNDILGIYTKYIKEKRAENNLKYLNTGVSIQHVKTIFGTPIVENYDKKTKLTEYLYSFKNFYLQIIYDINNKVKFYSVVVKNNSFHPEIPYIKNVIYLNEYVNKYIKSKTLDEILKMKLPQPNIGKKTFDELLKNNNDIVYSNLSSKFFEYAEKVCLANPGNYRTLYIAYNPAGIDFSGNCFTSVLYENGKLYPNTEEAKNEIKKFRKNCMPNTFAVGEILGTDPKILKTFKIGIDYYLSRDLPEFNY